VIDGSARQEIGFSFDDQSPPSFPDKQSSTKTTSTALFHPSPLNRPSSRSLHPSPNHLLFRKYSHLASSPWAPQPGSSLRTQHSNQRRPVASGTPALQQHSRRPNSPHASSLLALGQGWKCSGPLARTSPLLAPSAARPAWQRLLGPLLLPQRERPISAYLPAVETGLSVGVAVARQPQQSAH
jgi:hypothetical protein